MDWQLFLCESDESEFATYALPNGQTLLAHRDLSVKHYPRGFHAIDLPEVSLTIGVQFDSLIIFTDRCRSAPGIKVNILDRFEPASYHSLETLQTLRIESIACYPTLTAAGGPGIAVQIKTQKNRSVSLKWWDTDLGPFPMPLES